MKRLLVSLFIVVAASFSLSPAAFCADAKGLPTDRPLTLEECINYALGTHPKIKGAEQDVDASRYRTKEAMSAFWPQVSFTANRSYISNQSVIRIPGKSGIVVADFISNNLIFNTNWILFDFGRTYYSVKSLAATEDSLIKTLSGSQQTVAYNVMDDYYALLKAQKLVAVAQETLDDSSAHLKQAQAFFEIGTKPKFDVTQAEVQVDNAQVALIQANDAVRTAAANLNTRIGLDPLTKITVQDRPELEKLDKDMPGYVEEAIKNRPDIQTLEDQLRSTDYLVSAAYSGFLPSLSASATQTWYKEDHSDMLSDQSVQLAVTVPIFTGLLLESKVSEMKAARLSTGYKIEDLKNDVRQSVSQAYIAVEDAKARFTALETSVKAAKENLQIAQDRYEAGVGTLLDVTDAQTSLTSAQTNLATAFYDYHSAYSSLLRNTGKGVK